MHLPTAGPSSLVLAEYAKIRHLLLPMTDTVSSWKVSVRHSVVRAWYDDPVHAERWELVAGAVEAVTRSVVLLSVGTVLFFGGHWAFDLLLPDVLHDIESRLPGTTLDKASFQRFIHTAWDIMIFLWLMLRSLAVVRRDEPSSLLRLLGRMAVWRQGRTPAALQDLGVLWRVREQSLLPPRRPRSMAAWMQHPLGATLVLWALDPAKTARDEAQMLDDLLPQPVPSPTVSKNKRTRI